MCPIFELNRWVHSAAQTFSGPLISLLTRLTHVPCRAILCGLQTACGRRRLVTVSLFNNEFVLFCINNQAQFSVHLSNSCFERVLETFFDAGRGFYINSPESSHLFVFILLTWSDTNYSKWSTGIF